MTDIGWPGAGVVSSADLGVFAASGLTRTLLSGTNVTRSTHEATPNATVAIAGGTGLVADDALSNAIRTAAMATTDEAWRTAMAEVYAQLAVVSAERPGTARTLLATFDRGWPPTSTRLSQTLDALAGVPWQAPATLKAALAAAPTPGVAFRSQSEPVGRIDLGRLLLKREAEVTAFSTALADPVALTAAQRLDLLGLLATSWTAQPAGWRDEVSTSLATAFDVLRSVNVTTRGPINVAANKVDFPITLRNEFDQAVTVRLQVVPSNGRLVVGSGAQSTIAANSARTVSVPVTAAIGNGSVTLRVTMYSLAGVPVGRSRPHRGQRAGGLGGHRCLDPRDPHHSVLRIRRLAQHPPSPQGTRGGPPRSPRPPETHCPGIPGTPQPSGIHRACGTQRAHTEPTSPGPSPPAPQSRGPTDQTAAPHVPTPPPPRIPRRTSVASAGGIGRASVFLASGTIVSRILGFVKLFVLARVIGLVGQSTDAFSVANQLPNTVYVIVAGGVLTAVLVPQIVRASLHDDGGTAYINKLVTLALVILGVTTIAATALALPLTLIWGSNLPPGQLSLAVAFAYWCLPQIFFYGVYTVLGEVLNARKSFGPSTWVPVLNNVVAIAGLVVFMLMFGADPSGLRLATDFTPPMIAVLAGSATLGVVAQALVLFYFWRRIGLRFRPDLHWRGVGLGAAGKMASWTFGMLILTTIAGIIETRVVTLASGTDASVAVLSTAWLIFMLPHSVITVSVATAYFTRMSEHASRGDTALLRTDASSAMRGTTLVIVLATAVIMVCAYPFAAVFVSSFGQVQGTGNVIIAFMIGLVAFCLLFVIQRTFYALGDTKMPFYFTLFQVVLIVIGSLGCAYLPKEWIAFGIALVVTGSGIAQTMLAAWLLRRRLGTIDGRRVIQSLVKYLVAAIIPVALGLLLLVLLGGTRAGGFAVSGIVPALGSMAAIGLVMSITYFGLLLLMRSDELRGFLEPLRARIRR